MFLHTPAWLDMGLRPAPGKVRGPISIGVSQASLTLPLGDREKGLGSIYRKNRSRATGYQSSALSRSTQILHAQQGRGEGYRRQR